jgi:arachidonate 15-lipoxygenase
MIVSHLARTHLFVEPFLVATHLALADHHAVSLLLRPHFEGTIFIKWSAIHFLVSDGGGVDQLQAGTIASDLKVAAESLMRTPFDEAVATVSLPILRQLHRAVPHCPSPGSTAPTSPVWP